MHRSGAWLSTASDVFRSSNPPHALCGRSSPLHERSGNQTLLLPLRNRVDPLSNLFPRQEGRITRIGERNRLGGAEADILSPSAGLDAKNPARCALAVDFEEKAVSVRVTAWLRERSNLDRRELTHRFSSILPHTFPHTLCGKVRDRLKSSGTKKPLISGLLWLIFGGFSSPKKGRDGGAGGIRTLDTLLAYTHFPGERLRPLGHRSACPGRKRGPRGCIVDAQAQEPGDCLSRGRRATRRSC